MRPAVLLTVLAFALGCGGSDASRGSRAFLRISGGATEELGTGVDAGGGAALVAVAADGKVRVVTEAGASEFAIPPISVNAPPRVTGDFVLVSGASPGVVGSSGTMIVDRRTGASRLSDGDFPTVSDGSRVVWETEGGPVLEDLATGTRTLVAEADFVAAIRGGWMVVGKQVGTKVVEGLPVPVFGHFLQPVGGGARVALA